MGAERKGRRHLGLLLALVLVFNAILQGSIPVFAAGEPKAVDVNITKFELQNRDKQTANEIWYTDTFLLMMEWDAGKNGANIHKGDYFDVTLPAKMRFPANTTARDFNLIDKNGVALATAHVTPGPGEIGGTVRVTFTDKVENMYNVKGTMYLAAKFDTKQIKTGENNNFTITVNSDVLGLTHSEDDGVIIQGPKKVVDEYLFKWGGKVEGIPNQAAWHVRINHKKANLTNVVISDTLSLPGEAFIPDSFRLFAVTFNEFGGYTNKTPVANLDKILTFGEGNKSFTLNLGNTDSKQYYLEYKTTYTPGSKLVNHVKLKSTEQSKEWKASFRSAESSGTASGDLASKIKLIKVDAEDHNITLANAVFTVTKPDGSTFELTTGSDGTITSDALEQGNYRVKEKIAPSGYELNGEEHILTISPTGGAIHTITNKPIKISVAGTKTWDDANNRDGKRPEKIIVNLFADGVKVKEQEVKADGNGNWKYTFTDLRKVKNGKEIKYTVTENPVEGYTPTINGFDITNKYTPEMIEVAGTKTWDDANNRDGKRPEKIIVNLLADGTQVKTAEVKADGNGNWKYSFSGLPKYKDGKEIKYTVTENTVAGYTTEINGYDIKNSYKPGKTSVTVTKRWDDANNKDKIRPNSIKVQLYADGEKLGEAVVLKAADKWTYSWRELPAMKDGKAIRYTVKEVGKVAGYTASVNDKDHGNIIITNSHKPNRPPVPKTGDGTGTTIFLAGLALTMVVISGAIVGRKRFETK